MGVGGGFRAYMYIADLQDVGGGGGMRLWLIGRDLSPISMINDIGVYLISEHPILD